jgi:AcrR family transcriptional regulator
VTATTARRDDLRARIVDAAAHLLSEHGAPALTTRNVAERAGVQPPAIYRLFGDKDGLLEAVAEHVLDVFVTAKREVVDAAAAADLDPLVDLHSGWLTQIEFGLANPAMFRLLSDPERAASSAAYRSGMQVLEARVHRLAETGRLRVSERRVVDVIRAAGNGTVTTLLASPPEERDADLPEIMWQAAMSQVLTDAPASPAEAPVAALVAVRALAPGLDVLSDAERQVLAEWLDRAVDASG